MKMIKKYRASFIVGIFTSILCSLPVRSAERIIFTFGLLKLSVPVSSLENYAKDGTIDPDLNPYLKDFSTKDKEEFRTLLTTQLPLNPVMTSRFLNSDIGEEILVNLGKAVTIEGGINGKYALRGAIVQSAFDKGGFTLLGFLQKFPTNIEFSGEYLLGLYQQKSFIDRASQMLSEKFIEFSALEAKSDLPQVDFSKLKDLRQLGKYSYSKEIWQLNDTKRNRQFYVLVFKPKDSPEVKTPVVVISHGLSSKPEDFSDIAEHLASYGYVVALPQHPGSDDKYLEDMLSGYHRNVFDFNEFVNRPLDISYVIDELERRNQKEFGGKLNLSQVGAIGHSFGGYTVLALAGATIDFNKLAKDCGKPYTILNAALLLECRALDLPHQEYHLQDKRIASVIGLNPVNRSLFGPTGLANVTIPVLLVSGSHDRITPAVFEQGASFLWLGSSKKYWMMEQGGTHVDFSKLDSGITSSIEEIGILEVPDSASIDKEFNAFALAFNEVYTSGNNKYLPYLQSSYGFYISKKKGPEFRILSEKSQDKIIEAILKFRKNNNINLQWKLMD